MWQVRCRPRSIFAHGTYTRRWHWQRQCPRPKRAMYRLSVLTYHGSHATCHCSPTDAATRTQRYTRCIRFPFSPAGLPRREPLETPPSLVVDHDDSERVDGDHDDTHARFDFQPENPPEGIVGGAVGSRGRDADDGDDDHKDTKAKDTPEPELQTEIELGLPEKPNRDGNH